MDLTPQAHLTKVRNLLTDRWLELRAEVEAAEEARKVAPGAAAHEVTDRKDEAAQHLFSELDGAQEQRDVDEMARVEAALHRLEGGTYGNCKDCGQPISAQRQLVLPEAARCALCQVACERAADRAGPRRAF